MRRALLALTFSMLAQPIFAQERPDLMIVFDGSGSMWGQLQGRTKIELAREALSSVLSEVDANTNVGMLAYGHRVRGQCSDIELMVPSGPAMQTVPEIISRANALTPRGMTPLTDSVLRAAESLSFTEQAATVVLLTDGIETCAGDPCALGRMLAERGIDFRAHVVGFDLTDSEQRQVACLAEETGGMFLSADDADDLRRALAMTLVAAPAVEPEPEPQPVLTTRPVRLLLRDTTAGPVLNSNQFEILMIEPIEETLPNVTDLRRQGGGTAPTAEASLMPGNYRVMLSRRTSGRGVIRTSVPFEVPAGVGAHDIDLVIASRLQLQIRLWQDATPFPAGNGNLPAGAISGYGRVESSLYQVVDGAVDITVDYGGIGSLDVALPPGDYLLRSTVSGIIGRETLLHVPASEVTRIDFDFGVAQVNVDARDRDGFPIPRVATRLFDPRTDAVFASGQSFVGEKHQAFYLPPGAWKIETGRDGGGDERAQMGVLIDMPGENLTLRPVVSGQISDADMAAVMAEDNSGCLALDARFGCMIEIVTPERMRRFAGGAETLAPRFTGTWAYSGRLWSLVQDGRRVWGDVQVNGATGRFWGEVAEDGLTLRGSMEHFSNPRGAMELRLDRDGTGLSGRTHHSFSLADSVQARRISAARPPLSVARGTDDDLRMTTFGTLWEPADGPEFAAFMAPARRSAPAGTEGDLDAMQTQAAPVGFTGRWQSDHQVLTLHQVGRRVWGRRDNGTLEGEVSADGTLLRGIWDNGGRWGPFEFRLTPDRNAFEGSWGEGSTELNRGAWNGTRRTWLIEEVAEVTRRSDASGPAFDAFFGPARDADHTPAQQGAVPAATGATATSGVGNPAAWGEGAVFNPIIRYDFKHTFEDRLAVSFVFGEDQPSEISTHFNPGFVWLVEGWCGEGCPSEVFALGGGFSIDQVPNALDRLMKGGSFPALEPGRKGLAVFDVFEGSPTEMGLLIRFITGSYSEYDESWRSQIVDNAGTYHGQIIRDFTLADWPDLPITISSADPSDDVLNVQGFDMVIGTVFPMPSGVFATLELTEPDWKGQGFGALDDPREMGRMAMQCATNPVVVHPDGLIAERTFDMTRAMSGGPAFSTSRYSLCSQSGPIVDCERYNGPMGTPRGQPVALVHGFLSEGASGAFALVTEGVTTLFRDCLLPHGFMAADTRGGDGRRIIEHIGAREDGKPGLDFDANGKVIAAAQSTPTPNDGQTQPSPAQGTNSYAAMAGIYFMPERGSATELCQSNPIHMSDAGKITVWSVYGPDTFVNDAEIQCDDAGRCINIEDPTRSVAELRPSASGLSMCVPNSGCTELSHCPAGLVPDAVAAHLANPETRQDGPIVQYPAGIYLRDRVGIDFATTDPFALIDACVLEPTVVYPDGYVEHLYWQADLDPPRFLTRTEARCGQSGDDNWPLDCEITEHLSSGTTDVYDARKHLSQTNDGKLRVSMEPAPGSAIPDDEIYLQCMDAQGLGLNLRASPVGTRLMDMISVERVDGGVGLRID